MATRGFTLASGQDVFSIEPSKRLSSPTTSALTGSEAKGFYENLIREDNGRNSSDSVITPEGDGCRYRSQKNKESRGRASRRRVRAAEMRRDQTDRAPHQRGAETPASQTDQPADNTERPMELMGLRLLRCAHEGNICGLKDLLSRGADINFQDTFFWTALMCASWSGQRTAVRLLLQHGAAWVGVVDTRGRDAKDLALEAGHKDVLAELESFGRLTQRNTQSNSSAAQPQWCDVCRSEYSSSLSSHLSSTLHQFSLQRPPPTPYYCLPASSISYKMMVRCGWKPGTGLGPKGEGHKQPVSTVLKRDQEGLGYGQAKTAKVTHFQARDDDAVKLASKKKEERGGKRQREKERRKEQRHKNWERDFRASFYL